MNPIYSEEPTLISSTKADPIRLALRTDPIAGAPNQGTSSDAKELPSTTIPSVNDETSGSSRN